MDSVAVIFEPRVQSSIAFISILMLHKTRSEFLVPTVNSQHTVVMCLCTNDAIWIIQLEMARVLSYVMHLLLRFQPAFRCPRELFLQPRKHGKLPDSCRLSMNTRAPQRFAMPITLDGLQHALFWAIHGELIANTLVFMMLCFLAVLALACVNKFALIQHHDGLR